MQSLMFSTFMVSDKIPMSTFLTSPGTWPTKIMYIIYPTYHATFDIYHIYSVRENRNFKVFATYGHSAGGPDTDHYKDTFFMWVEHFERTRTVILDFAVKQTQRRDEYTWRMKKAWEGNWSSGHKKVTLWVRHLSGTLQEKRKAKGETKWS